MEFKKPDGLENIFRSTAPANKDVVMTTGTSGEKVITSLPIDSLVPYENHPFKLYEGKRLDDMVVSIKELGVIVPVVVRQLNDKRMEILSGHNRVNAARLAGLKEVPVHIKYHMHNDDALLIVTETNLMQRSVADLSHSERARAFAKHMEALKYTGLKKVLFNEIESLSNPDEIYADEQGGPMDHLNKNRDVIGEKFNLSGSSIARYLRIDVLVNELKELVDKEEICIRAGVDLSFLRQREQTAVAAIVQTGKKVDMKIAKALREKSKVNEMTFDTINNVIYGTDTKPAKTQKEKKISFPASKLSAYFDSGFKKKEIEATVIEALEFYFEHKKKEEQGGE